jgi:putative ABC transport system substrate-binding protein
VKRRDFITLLGGAATAVWSVSGLAEFKRPVRIGFLTAGGDSGSTFYQAFRQELRRLGYFEGENTIIEFRSAGGNDGRIQALATELVALAVDIIVTWGAPATIAAKHATSVIPIVIGVAADPIASGLVQNLARPGGNVTGFSTLAPELGTKRVELLREAVPNLNRVGILWSPANAANGKPQVETIVNAAQALGIHPAIEGADNADGIVGAIEALTKRDVSALMIIGDSVLPANISGLLNWQQ